MGVPVGYQHRWRYNGVWKERKAAPGQWRFRYAASKTNNKHLIGGMKRGQRIHWRIQADQYAVKTAPNRYRIVTVGRKRLVSTHRGRP